MADDFLNIDGTLPDSDYEGVYKNDPYETSYTTPMSPMFDAYKMLNENYARFLESPQAVMSQILSRTTYDPKGMALLNENNRNSKASLGEGVLEGLLAAHGIGRFGGGGAAGGGGPLGLNAAEGSYMNMLGMQQKAGEAANKTRDALLKDPTIARADAQLSVYNDFASQWKNFLNSGSTDKNGNKVYSPIQARTLLGSLLQMVRPGARVNADTGEVTDDAGNLLTGGPFDVFGKLLSRFAGTTAMPLEGNDIKGVAAIAHSIRDSAISTHNGRVDYLKNTDAQIYKPHYEALKYNLAGSNEEADPNMEAIYKASRASMEADAAERAEKSSIMSAAIPEVKGGGNKGVAPEVIKKYVAIIADPKSTTYMKQQAAKFLTDKGFDAQGNPTKAVK